MMGDIVDAVLIIGGFAIVYSGVYDASKHLCEHIRYRIYRYKRLKEITMIPGKKKERLFWEFLYH